MRISSDVQRRISMEKKHWMSSLFFVGSKTPFQSFLGIAQQHATQNGVSDKIRFLPYLGRREATEVSTVYEKGRG